MEEVVSGGRKFVMLEGLLQYVNPGRKDQVRLVVPEVLRSRGDAWRQLCRALFCEGVGETV